MLQALIEFFSCCVVPPRITYCICLLIFKNQLLFLQACERNKALILSYLPFMISHGVEGERGRNLGLGWFL